MPIEPRLLIVDDEEVICQSCRRILGGRGFHIETCTDPQVGLQMARENAYDAIVLDVRMPVISGIQFLEHLREAHLHVPVVVMSGRAGEAAEAAVARLGAAEYLAKPFTPDEITQAVRRSLGKR